MVAAAAGCESAAGRCVDVATLPASTLLDLPVPFSWTARLVQPPQPLGSSRMLCCSAGIFSGTQTLRWLMFALLGRGLLGARCIRLGSSAGDGCASVPRTEPDTESNDCILSTVKGAVAGAVAQMIFSIARSARQSWREVARIIAQ